MSVTNLTAVPVLAEPNWNMKKTRNIGEARESTNGDAEPVVRLNERSNLVGPTSDSRSGSQNFNEAPCSYLVDAKAEIQFCNPPQHSEQP